MIPMREISYSGLHYVPKFFLKMGGTLLKRYAYKNAGCFVGVGLYSVSNAVFFNIQRP